MAVVLNNIWCGGNNLVTKIQKQFINMITKLKKTLSLMAILIIYSSVFVYALQPESNIEDTDHQGTDWTIIHDTMIAGVHSNIGTFRIANGAVLLIQPRDADKYGYLILEASSVTINPGHISASGSGFKGGKGGLPVNGAGDPGFFGDGPGKGNGGNGFSHAGSGGGYGSAGGNSGAGELAGSTYGNFNLNSIPVSDDDIQMGSGGGGGNGANISFGGSGGHGGGFILINSTDILINAGVTLKSNGLNGLNAPSDCCGGAGGAGSGGGILLFGSKVSVLGSIIAKGGIGGQGAGNAGGGSGGRVKIFYRHKNINNSNINVSGGASANTVSGFPPGSPGENGTVYYNQIPAVPIHISPLAGSATAQPYFDWTDSVDNEGPPVQNYEIQISPSVSFDSIFHTASPNVSQYEIPTQLPGTFHWRVRAFDGEVYSDWSEPWVVIGDVGLPTGLTIDSVKAHTSSISVEVSVGDFSLSGPHEQPYWIDVSSDSSFVWVSTSSGWIASNSWLPSELLPDTPYSIRFKARNGAVTESGWINSVSTRTTTTRPDSLAVDSIGSSSVQVSWSAGINPVGTQYSAQISENPSFPGGASTTIDIVSALNHTFTSLDPNKTYYIRIANKDWTAFASEFVNTDIVTLPNPVVPGLFASVTQNSIIAKWTEGGNPLETEYRVEVSSTGGIIAQSPWQQALEFNFTGLNSNVLYIFRTKARNSVLSDGTLVSLGSKATLASAPPMPEVIGGFDDEFGLNYFFKIIPDFGTNSAETEMAIRRTGSQEYLQGNGTKSTTVVWKTKAEWEDSFVTNAVSVNFGTFLDFHVVARNFDGLLSADSPSGSGTLPPDQPPSLNVSISSDSLVLNYTGVSRAASYWIYYSPEITAPTSSLVFIASTTGTQFHDKTIPCNPPSTPTTTLDSVQSDSVELSWTTSVVEACQGPRYYKVAAADSQGQVGQKSDVGSGATTLNPNIEEYEVYRNDELIASTSDKNYTDNLVAQNVTYTYVIKARSSQGSLSNGSALVTATIPISGLGITQREMHDTDEDGQGDTVKLFFNQNIVDSTVIVSDFEVDENPGLSLLTNIPGDAANDTILHVWVGNQFKSDASPGVKYNGSTIQSDLNQVLVSDPSAVNADDKVAPSIETLTVVSFTGRAVIHIKFSENVTEASVDGIALWQVEAPIGSPISLIPAEPKFNNQDTFSLSFLNELSAASVKVSASNVVDNLGNIRTSVEETTTNILRQPYSYTLEKDDQEWKAEGPAVFFSAQIVLAFDREMDKASLESASSIRLFLTQTWNGVPSNNEISGVTTVSPGNRIATFVPNSNSLQKGSRFEVVVSTDVKDAFGISGAESSWEFATAIDHSLAEDSITNPLPEFRVSVNPGALAQDAGIFMVTDPAANAQYTNRNLIFRAQELEFRKANQTGSPIHFPIPALTFEIAGLTPAGQVVKGELGRNIDISVDYPDIDNNGILDFTNPGVPVKDLAFYILDEGLGEFIKIPSVIDRAAKTITASINRFSVYAVMGELLTSVQSFRIRPTQWQAHIDPQPVILDNLPEDARINVYNVRGQKVKTLYSDGRSSIQWRGTTDSGAPLASGVYVLVLKGPGGTKAKKLTIIR